MIKSLFRQMTPEEISIEGIQNIKMLHIYDLTGATGTGQRYGVTALLVNYDDNKQLNFTENDYCFKAFVNKIFEVYNACENKDMIIMDEMTRKILEAGEIPKHELMLKKYYEAPKNDSPILVNASTLSKRFGPFVEYLITGLYKTMGTDVDIIERQYGWRGAGSILLKVGNNGRRIFFKVFEINDSMVSIKTNGFLSDKGDLLINITLYNNEITFSYSSASEKIEGSGSFDFRKESLREMQEVKKNGEQIFYDVNLYENPINPAGNNPGNAILNPTGANAGNDTGTNTLMDGLEWLQYTGLEEHFPDKTPCARYSLPFGMDYILYSENDETDQLEINTCCGAFLWEDAAYSDIRGWSVIKSKQSGLALKNEEFRVVNISDKRGMIQSAFLSGTGSRYQKELEGKYVINGSKIK